MKHCDARFACASEHAHNQPRRKTSPERAATSLPEGLEAAKAIQTDGFARTRPPASSRGRRPSICWPETVAGSHDRGGESRRERQPDGYGARRRTVAEIAAGTGPERAGGRSGTLRFRRIDTLPARRYGRIFDRFVQRRGQVCAADGDGSSAAAAAAALGSSPSFTLTRTSRRANWMPLASNSFCTRL